MPIDSSALAIIGLSFLLAGVIKGTVGLGLSTVSLVLLTATIGLLTGISTGLTGAFEAPAAMYFQALGLPHNQMVQAIALICTASTIGLAVGLSDQRLLNTELVMVSTGAVAPAVIGMVLGSRLRQQIPAARFRRVFFVALLALGLYVLTQSL
jgi:uncharacterized membrane protein YfcA